MAQYDARRAMLEEDMGWETEAEYYGMSEEEFLELVAPLTDDELCAIDEDSSFEWDAPVSCISVQPAPVFQKQEAEERVKPVCFRASPPPENNGIGIRPPMECHAEHPINPTPPSRALARDGDFHHPPISCISVRINQRRKESDMERQKAQESSASEKYRAALMRMNPEQRRRAHEMAMLIRGMKSKNQEQNKSHETNKSPS